MPKPTDAVALTLDTQAIEGALQQLASMQRGVTLSARITGAQRTELGVTLQFADALMHLGPTPAPLPERVHVPAAKEPEPVA